MWIAETKASLSRELDFADGEVVLVPTMGALHLGHAALIRAAREHANPGGRVVVSIFVNPTQFDNPQDLKTYPRNIEADLALCRSLEVDGIFLPSATELYASDHSISISETELSQTLCGASRPGHFAGVCTIVLKLFSLTRASAAVFGEKDYQQLAIIRRLVRDLNLPVKILPHPTLREADGLAMSSRNARLTTDQQKIAPLIYQALQSASAEISVANILAKAREQLSASPHLKIDYLSLVDPDSLRDVLDLAKPSLLATAVFLGSVRLIDNLIIPPRN